MRKTLLILFFIIIPSYTFPGIGENKDYSIISQNDYSKLISRGRDVTLRRYLVVPNLDNNFKNIFDTTDERVALAKFSFMLRKNKRAWIEKYLENNDNSLGINDLIKGLYYFSKKQYTEALIHLGNFNNEENKFLKYLLIADCEYELLPGTEDYKTRIEVYQNAMNHAISELDRKIINNRIKYIRYR
jgi:hypothetical protein